VGRITIAMHGGAINPADDTFGQALAASARAGLAAMRAGGSALDAVVEAVAAAEDDPLFNSGTGSHLTLAGTLEMDASVMDGATLGAGGVACISRVKNPIRVARKVMEETDHILLVGEGARRFAHRLGFEDYEPLTPQRRAEWQEAVGRLKRGEAVPGRSEYWHKISRWVGAYADTDGAVAMDARGNVAAATSSGGFPLKLPGRVGDVPIIGAGTYADNRKGACSVTGQGEVVIKMGLAKLVCDLMGSGIPAQQAVESAVAQWNTRFGRYILALVALDMNGTVGACRNVPETPHAWLEEGGPERINWSPILRPADR